MNLLALLPLDRLTHECRHDGCPVDVGPHDLLCTTHRFADRYAVRDANNDRNYRHHRRDRL